MKIQIINRQKMQWESSFKKVFPDAQWVKNPTNEADIYIFMWCDDTTVNFINKAPKYGKYIVVIRRYEYYNNWIEELDWERVDDVICVNDFIAWGFKQRTGRDAYIIYNGVNAKEWTFKDRNHGNKIAMVGFVNQKKNFPLALQILAKLPQDYELHIAGGYQDGATLDYITHIANKICKKIMFYNQMPHEFIDKWLEDKNYILSTAISEGCPNNVIEAMAKGITPIVHNWPGSEQQSDGLTFDTVDEAIAMILDSDYESQKYREIVENKFGESNFLEFKKVVEKEYVCA